MDGTVQNKPKLVGTLSTGGSINGGLGAVFGKDGKSAYEIAVDHGFKGTEEEWLESLKAEGAVTPQSFGAKGDGIADDTDAFENALSASKYVLVPEGEYRITRPLKLKQGVSLAGVGDGSVIACESGNNLFGLGAYTQIRDLAISVKGAFDGSLVEINEETISDNNTPNTGNLGIVISNTSFLWNDTEQKYRNCANIEIRCSENADRDGFYGVSITGVRMNAHHECDVGYFVRAYTKGDKWITGCTIAACSVYGCRWFYFAHTSDDDFANLDTTGGIGALTIHRCQHQCSDKTRGFVFFRKGSSEQITDCVPWDWQSAEEEYINHPYCFEKGRFTENVAWAYKTTITPAPDPRQLAEIDTDGTVTPAKWEDAYYLSKNVGTNYVDVGLLPKQMMIKRNLETSEMCSAVLLYQWSKLDGFNRSVYFDLLDYDGKLKRVKVNLFVGLGKFSVESDMVLSAETKFGYINDGTLKLYIYTMGGFNYRQYLVSHPLEDKDTIGYSGGRTQMDYANTINTFSVPVSERYFWEIPVCNEITERIAWQADSAVEDGSITENKLSDGIKLSKFVNDTKYVTEDDVGASAVPEVMVVQISEENGQLVADKTYTEFANAVNGGLVVIAKYSGCAYTLQRFDLQSSCFASIYRTNNQLTLRTLDFVLNGVVSYNESSFVPSMSITYDELAEGAVEEDILANGAVTESKLADSAVTTNKLASGAITNEKLGAACVKGSNINNLAITTAKISNYQITYEKMADAAVTTRTIKDEAVTSAKLASDVKTEIANIVLGMLQNGDGVSY